jgi:hypothetical protein
LLPGRLTPVYFSLTKLRDSRAACPKGFVMRLIVSAGLVIALVFPLVGCVAPNQGASAVVPKTPYPTNLVLPSDVLPVLL